MGLYIKLQRNYDTDEKTLLDLYQLLIERLTKYFKFRPLNDYILWDGDLDEEELKKTKDFDSKSLQSIINTHRIKIKEKTDKIPHYSVSVEGVLELKTEDNSTEKILVDVLGTCTQFKDLYGNVWIEFYNASKKWHDYFLGNDSNSKINRDNIYSLINDIKTPDFRIYTIFFAESNLVYDLLNKVYFLYFKEYKFYIETITKIIQDRLTEKNLEYEDIILSERKRPLIATIQNDLKLLNTSELVDIIDRKTPEFSNNFSKFVSDQYKGMITYTTASSVVIKDKTMNPMRIRSAITDFIGNYLSTLYDALPRYNDVEKNIKRNFTQHKFEQEKGKKQSKLD